MKDKKLASYMALKRLPKGCWGWRIATDGLSDIHESAEILRISEQSLRHEVDLLGSGPLCVNRFGELQQFDHDGNWLKACVSSRNLRRSQQIWQMIFHGSWASAKYHPIDWQRDFKSGSCWDSRTWFLDVQIGKVAGADIKVPWELARLQHLPLMAIRACQQRIGSEGATASKKKYVVEIRAQILDFIASNPPRYGIHWRTPMEVAIRGANILLCLDILHSGGVSLDHAAMQTIHDFIDAQTRHILANLEWSEQERGNHYYANILGVLFAATYLPDSPERRAWKAFAVHQLNLETDRQFLDDGGNFEGSSGYHRLTLEMAVYALAIVRGYESSEQKDFETYDRSLINVRPPFPAAPSPLFMTEQGESRFSSQVHAKIFSAVNFLVHLTRPDRRFTQIGDIDSARLFKLEPICRDGREDTVNPSGVIGAASGLFPDCNDELTCLDQKIVHHLSRGNSLKAISIGGFDTGGEGLGKLREQFLSEYDRSDNKHKHRTFISGDVPFNQLTLFKYPIFGVYILKAPSFHLSFRCFDHRKGGSWGHAHDDNLSLELVIDGVPILTDPGSFVYTADTERRELYRGHGSHFVPRAKGCFAADTNSSLFSIRHLATAHCLAAEKSGFIAHLQGDEWSVKRMIAVEPSGIEIWDIAVGAELEPYLVKQAIHPTTDGYGRETQNPICTL
ncbi:MAG: heparinase II/III family protein [Thalassospira sp.]|uniref:heparinase II/III family protein n=1 Tax=Thalassospira sp. TaxID=1912094 RepID=UPI003A8484DB